MPLFRSGSHFFLLAAIVALIVSGCDSGQSSDVTDGAGSSLNGSTSSSSTSSSSGSGSTSSGSSSSSGSTSASSSSSSSGTSTSAATKSAKRGIAYDLSDPPDFAALSSGVSWWYNWASQPNSNAPSDDLDAYRMHYYPMLWNGNYDAAAVESYLAAHPDVRYLLVLNEPNLTTQANVTPQQAAAIWPGYEAIAARTGVKIVGPAITWGTMAGYEDPVAWLDAFYAAYEAANGGRDPQIDYLAFHWYDYGLAGQLDRLDKYGKSIWVTEMANWHSANDGAQIDTLAKQEAQMEDMVATCESRSDVFRYAWFTGRRSNDVHFTSLLSTTAGELTGLGQLYLTQSFTAQ